MSEDYKKRKNSVELSVLCGEKSEFIIHKSINPFPLTPHRLMVRSGRSIRRYGHTAIRALPCGRVTVFVLVLALVDGLVKLQNQVLVGWAARIHEEPEIVLGIARRDDMPFVTNGTYMTLEAFHNSGKERVELLL